nr:zf-HC2 domain-containing protein [uncultured Anaerotignum sp.]
MNWKCELVMDLAPLYYDGVASAVSKRLVKKHLHECAQCRSYYKRYRPVDKVPAEVPNWDVGENYAMLAKRVRRRRLVLWSGFLTYLCATVFAMVLYYVKEQNN